MSVGGGTDGTQQVKHTDTDILTKHLTNIKYNCKMKLNISQKTVGSVIFGHCRMQCSSNH